MFDIKITNIVIYISNLTVRYFIKYSNILYLYIEVLNYNNLLNIFNICIKKQHEYNVVS